MRRMYRQGYADVLRLMKVAQGGAIIPYEGYEWLPPGAASPQPGMRQGSEAAAYARSKGLGGKQPGLLSKMWGKFRRLPGKAQLGIGLGAAGGLAAAIAAARSAKKHPESRYTERDMRPELQAAQYAGPQNFYREEPYPQYYRY